MRKQPRPGRRQLEARAALEELALVHRRVDHATVVEHLARRLGGYEAKETLQRTKRRNFLPPGCRMTATHFEFS